jgi:probable F420-dependent oxidoreductase
MEEAAMTIEVGRIGVWSAPIRRGDRAKGLDAVIELESLGYGTVWMPGGEGAEYFDIAAGLLAATRRIVVVPGILSVWINPAAEAAAAQAALSARYPGRVLLGLGVSHAHQVESQTGRKFEHPVAVMNEYLDSLARTPTPVAREELVLAALGPRMLELARDRSAGAHPYFTTPEHTRLARFVLGSGRLLAPEQAVVLETNPERAREIARRHMARYLAAPNYTSNLLRLGFGEADFAAPGSDRLVDAIVAWGDLDAVRRRIDEHFAAGADHVCLQALPADPDPNALPLAEWRKLAALLRG